MIGKSTIKRIKLLALKKYRQKEKLFIVEGDKNVLEVLQSSFEVDQLLATESFLSENSKHLKYAKQITEVKADEIKKVSLLKNPQNSLIICSMPDNKPLPEKLDEDQSEAFRY